MSFYIVTLLVINWEDNIISKCIWVKFLNPKFQTLKIRKKIILWTLKHVSAIREHPVLLWYYVLLIIIKIESTLLVYIVNCWQFSSTFHWEQTEFWWLIDSWYATKVQKYSVKNSLAMSKNNASLHAYMSNWISFVQTILIFDKYCQKHCLIVSLIQLLH